MDLALNSSLDVDALAKAYARENRLSVKNVLAPESAERIHRCLVKETPWGLVYNEGEKVIEIPADKLAQITPDRMRQIYQGAFARAQKEYQFLYNYYPILTSYQSGKNREFFLHRVLEFVNSEPVLTFIRRLTGIESVIKADAQATLYRANSFLLLHNDIVGDEGRKCAYVFNFTKEWRPNWGGYLQFFDANGNVEKAIMPTFNTLNIFTVPQAHAVEFVPPFCPGLRFAITGWFRDR